MIMFAARDKNGELFFYEKEPRKGYTNQWTLQGSDTMMMHVPRWAQSKELRRIRWRDEKPTPVEIRIVNEQEKKGSES